MSLIGQMDVPESRRDVQRNHITSKVGQQAYKNQQFVGQNYESNQNHASDLTALNLRNVQGTHKVKVQQFVADLKQDPERTAEAICTKVATFISGAGKTSFTKM